VEPSQSYIETKLPPEFAKSFPGFTIEHDKELQKLGAFLGVFAPDPTSRRRNSRLLWFGFVFFFLIEALLVVVPFLPPPKDVKPAPLPLMVFFHLFILSLLIACGWRLRTLSLGSRVRAFVCAEGLAHFDGQTLTTCRWDEVKSVEGIIKGYSPGGHRMIVTVKFGADQEMRFDEAKEHLANTSALYQLIGDLSGRRLLPRFYAAIEAGQTVTFGQFGISKAGIHWGTHVLDWDDNERIEIRDGIVRIRRIFNRPLQPWARLMDFVLPNLVFLQLVEHYVRDNGRGTIPAWAK
jgi:hypothetical protein